MARKVVGGLIQCANPINDAEASVERVRDAMYEKHMPLIEEAGKRGVQILCLQEVFNGPYFCPSQDARWCDIAEEIPGPTTNRLAEYAKKYQMVIVVPDLRARDAGRLLQHRRRHRRRRQLPRHVPQEPHPADERLLGEVLLQAGQPRLPGVPDPLRQGRRLHLLRPPLPRGRAPARAERRRGRLQPLGHGRRASQYLWKLEQPAHAVANGYFLGAINRVGTEAPWNIGEFYGQSYFVDPRGQFLATGSRRSGRARRDARWTST